MIANIARILLGLIFLVIGLNGFFFFIPTPPVTGDAATFYHTMLATRYSVLVFGVQVIGAIMLLTNRYLPIALVTLAAVLANALDFHITMQPSGLPLPLCATVLWFIVVWPLRSQFALLFTQRVAARS
jgi:putative oxidoreductase